MPTPPAYRRRHIQPQFAEDILSRQYWCHAPKSGYTVQPADFSPEALFRALMIPERDIWRAAGRMLKRYGHKALEESATRADQLEGSVRRNSRIEQKPHVDKP
jgi:hypothetical protein